MGFKGVNVRQTGDRILFRESIKDSSGSIVTTGTTTLRIYELQSDGTLKSYDFNDNTFKTTALTTATASMTHRQGNNSTVNTGIWTYALTTVTGFTAGNIYISSVNNTAATPPSIEREFQYGSFESDMVLTAGATGIGYIQSDVIEIASNTTAATNLGAIYNSWETGTLQSATSTTAVLRSGASAVNDFFKDQVIFLLTNTGAKQTNRITAYTGSSKTCTVETTWATTPDNTTTYLIVGRIG